jgi:hypothetical protein
MVPAGGGDAIGLAPPRGDEPGTLVADERAVYWTQRTGHDGTDGTEGFTIFTLPLPAAPGAKPAVFAEGHEGWVVGMALDAASVWITNHGPVPVDPHGEPSGGTVTAYPRGGGSPRTVASGITAIGGVAVDDARVLFFDEGTLWIDGITQKGALRAVPKAGGASTTLRATFDASGVAADDAGVCASAVLVSGVACVPR